MSTTVVLTPFVKELARFLMSRTPEDLECIKALKAMNKQNRLSTIKEKLANSRTQLGQVGSQLDDIVRVPLHISMLDNLVQAAKGVGYKPISLDSSRVRLEKPNGDLVFLQRQGDKVEALATALHTCSIQEIVRQHSLTRATEHLKNRGMELRVSTLKNGELQIEGIDRWKTTSGKPAKVDVTIKNDGRLTVDVNGVTGKKCEQIVSEIAQAVGAVYEDVWRKPEYFQQTVQERQRV